MSPSTCTSRTSYASILPAACSTASGAAAPRPSSGTASEASSALPSAIAVK
jgi:hypothetical protein